MPSQEIPAMCTAAACVHFIISRRVVHAHGVRLAVSYQHGPVNLLHRGDADMDRDNARLLSGITSLERVKGQ